MLNEKEKSLFSSSLPKHITSGPIWISGKRKAFPCESHKKSRTLLGSLALKPKWAEQPILHGTGEHCSQLSGIHISETQETLLDAKCDWLQWNTVHKAVSSLPKFSIRVNSATSSEMTLSDWVAMLHAVQSEFLIQVLLVIQSWSLKSKQRDKTTKGSSMYMG